MTQNLLSLTLTEAELGEVDGAQAQCLEVLPANFDLTEAQNDLNLKLGRV